MFPENGTSGNHVENGFQRLYKMVQLGDNVQKIKLIYIYIYLLKYEVKELFYICCYFMLISLSDVHT